MRCQLLIGRAGTGKTTKIIDQIVTSVVADPLGPPIYLIVPDQAAYEMEKKLTQKMPRHTSVRAIVLPFHRLAEQYDQDGMMTPLARIREAGKYAFFIQAYREVEDQLTILRRQEQTPTFLLSVLSWLEECQQYNVTPSMVESALAEGSFDPFLEQKLTDMHKIYAAYRRRIEERYLDPYDLLPQFAHGLSLWPSMRDAQIYIDGFIGFTAQELQVIEAFLQAPIQALTITLSAPMEELRQPQHVHREPSLFMQAIDTYDRIQRMARQQERQFDLIDHVTKYRFQRAQQLNHLEENLFSSSHTLMPSTSQPQSAITLASARSRKTEVYGVVADILAKVKAKTHTFDDFVILVPKLDSYAGIIHEVLQEANLPYFMDERKPLHHHPIAVFILHALKLVTSSFQTRALLDLIKTDLFPMSRLQADRLENYALAHGIEGEMWLSPVLDTSQRDEWNELRKIIIASLRPFYLALQGNFDAKTLAHQLYALCEAVGVEAKVLSWMEEERAKGRLLVATMHERVYRAFVHALDDLVLAIGDEPLASDDAYLLFAQVFQGLTIGVIPATLSAIRVIEVARVRAFEVKTVYLLGCVEGAIPVKRSQDVFMSDAERERLREQGIEIGPASLRQDRYEKYRVYIALTRATQHLHLSYPVEEQGRPRTPSLLFQEMAMMFRTEDLTIYHEQDTITGQDKEDFSLCITAKRTARYLVTVLRRVQQGERLAPIWYAFYTWLATTDEDLTAIQTLFLGLTHRVTSEKLDDRIARQLYGEQLTLSVSRLEHFATCSFAHFARYGLALRERERYGIDLADRGTYLHEILHAFTVSLQEDGLSLGQLSDEVIEQRARSLFARKKGSFEDAALLVSARSTYLASQLEAIFLRVLAVLTEHARRSEFRPYQTELSFGYAQDEQSDAYHIALTNGQLRFRGRIDRLDIARDDDTIWYRIIDYKSSKRDFSFAKMYYGLSIQLPFYASLIYPRLVRELGQPVELAGLFYFPLIDPVTLVESKTDEQEARIVQRKELRMKGILRKDSRIVPLLDAKQVRDGSIDLFSKLVKKDGEFVANVSAVTTYEWHAIESFLVRLTQSFGNAILQGDTTINPYRMSKTDYACASCSMKAICQIEPSEHAATYRYLSVLSRDEVLANIVQTQKELVDGEDMVDDTTTSD